MTVNDVQLSDNMLYPHPFSKAYWKQAASELKKTKVLIFAALMIALRVALKMVNIPIGPDLKINSAFFINAYGAMVFGPVVSIVAAAISDTLGCILYPTGAYFFPFIFIEIAGSLIFALFFYRARITATRVILSRFCIDFFVNIVLNTPIMMLYYQVMMGKYYPIVDIARIVKNLCMFPLESVLLILFMRAVLPQSRRLKLVYSDVEKLRFTKRNIVLLVILFVIGTASVAGYMLYDYNTSSLSAGYTTEERLEKNLSMNEVVRQNNAQLEEATTVSIIESAIPKFGNPNITYSVAVYTLDQAQFEANQAEKGTDYSLDTLNGYSKSKAKADDSLVYVGMATIVADKDSGEIVSYVDDFE